MTVHKSQASVSNKYVTPVLYKWLATVMFLVCITGFSGWLVVKLNDPSTLPIRNIQVTGDFIYLNETMLRDVLSRQVNEGYFSANIDELQKKVEEIPWVDTASVRRRWPDTLKIHLTEQKALARWNKGGLVNKQGELFFPQEQTYPENLPVFIGLGVNSVKMTERYAGLTALLAPLKNKIQTLELDDRGSVKVQLENGLEIIVGREEATKRLARFVELYGKMLAADIGRVKRVDLRYANGIAVLWKQQPVNDRG